MSYRKVMFGGPNGQTAGLILTSEKIATLAKSGDLVSAVSRLFPMSEASKMVRLYMSPDFPTWDEAFAYAFEVQS